MFVRVDVEFKCIINNRRCHIENHILKLVDRLIIVAFILFCILKWLYKDLMVPIGIIAFIYFLNNIYRLIGIII
jgi:hypothetical protein